MAKEEVMEKFKKVFVEKTGIDSFNEEDKFIDDLGLDSLGVMDLITGLEEEFNITVPDSDIPKIKDVKSALDYISSKI
ncbi:MAG TPA: acyl carrier protein [Caldisericia bacterium]|nr:acyl carrier protein [bacterium]HOC52161.1 acyl carrier protein [Caldisericia bacterium]HOK17957.1 acyl carrier protein [Caldisericia bacterium]HOL82808.1 acyl carrier protein [Caldisericia bacterium]HPB33915.1 acyl carrier protein [Caldisericia bacterium]